jgi:hypothetical protein
MTLFSGGSVATLLLVLLAIEAALLLRMSILVGVDSR